MAENSVEVIENDLRRILGVGQRTEELKPVEGSRKNQAKSNKDNQGASHEPNIHQTPPKINLKKFQDTKSAGKSESGWNAFHHEEDDSDKAKKKKKRNKKIGNQTMESESPKIIKENRSKRKKTKWEIVNLKTPNETPNQPKVLLHEHPPSSPKKLTAPTEGFYHNSKPISFSQHSGPSLTFQQMRPPPDVLEFLEKNFIHPLKKRFNKFPRALFYCRLCDYHCDTVTVCERHIKDLRHQKNRETRELEATLLSLPDPTEPHAKVVSDVVLNISQEYGLSDSDIEIREGLMQELKDFALEDLKDCQLRLYGSSLSRFGLKSSDVNIDLVVKDSVKAADVLIIVFEKVKTWPFAENVQSDFTAKIPSIIFKETKTGLNCIINLNNVAGYCTASLLAEYISLDSRIRVLGIAFRYWAKICLIDKQMDGTLPSHSFALMVIYYLQQCQPPVIPVLHEFARNEKEIYLPVTELKEKWTCNNTKSIGELWLGLLKFYASTFETNDNVVCIQQSKLMKRSERGWSSKRLAIEDPFVSKRNLARSISSHLVAEFIFDRFKMTYKYFGTPQLSNGPLFDKLLLVDILHKDEKKAKSSSLLLDALENIANKNNDGSDGIIKYKKSFVPDPSMIVTISSKQGKNKDSKNGKNLTPKELKDDEEKLDSNEELNCNRDDAESDHSVSTRGDEDSEHELCIMNSLMEALDDDFEGGREENDDLNPLSDTDGEKIRRRNISEVSENIDSEIDSEDEGDEETEDKIIEKEMENSPIEICNGPQPKTDIVKRKIPPEIEEKLNNLTIADLIFKFDAVIFTNGKKPPVYCSLCQREGHLKHDCPEEKLPPLIDLPAIDPEYTAIVNGICHRIFEDNNPNQSVVNNRNMILSDLETFIKRIYPTAKLELFGSSCNGFGFAKSDLDICLTFENKNPEDIKFIPIIENLAEKLKKLKLLTNVIAITTAKVPIVKFIHRPSGLEGDISLYNTLAQHNTRMLNMYSEIDIRVKILGYVMKVFAKLCSIGDASRGSLSSYAYILMVIYYLQQTKPPVIPVLQELYDKNDKQPERKVDGWNAWFYDHMESLGEVWPHIGENKATVAELWLGLLRFYTETFRFQELVISIRQFKQLTRFEKLWNSKCIAIEDPFDLNHNLGAGVSSKMNIYIMKAFIRTRALFGIPRENYEHNPNGLSYILFNTNNMADGCPPNDRGCRSCGKIGHVVKHCPRKHVKNRDKRSHEMETNREREHLNDRRNHRDAFGRPPMNLRPGGQKDVQNVHMGLIRPMMAPIPLQLHNHNLRPMMPVVGMMNNPRQSAPSNVGHKDFNQAYDNRQALQHLEKISHKICDPNNVRKGPMLPTTSNQPLSRPAIHPGISGHPNQNDFASKKSSGKLVALPRDKSHHHHQQQMRRDHEMNQCQRSVSCASQHQLQQQQSFNELPIAKSKSSDSATMLGSGMKNSVGENMEMAHALTRSPSMTPSSGRGLIGYPLHLIRPGVTAPPGFTNLNVNFRMPHEAQLIRGPLTTQDAQHMHPGIASMQQSAFQPNLIMASAPQPQLGNYFANENTKLHQNSQAAPFCQYPPPVNYPMNIVPIVNCPPQPSTSAVNRIANQQQSNSAFSSPTSSSSQPNNATSSPSMVSRNCQDDMRNCQDDVMKGQICFLGERLPMSMTKEREKPNANVEKKSSLNFITKQDYKNE